MGTIITADAMTGSNWTRLTSRPGEVGATWTQHPTDSSGDGVMYLYGGRVHCGVTGANYASGVPPSADYTVTCDYRMYTDIGSMSIAARMSTSQSTYYYTYYGGGQVVLAKKVAGTITGIGWYPTAFVAGWHELALACSGTTIKVYWDGTERISVTDASISAAGRVGVRAGGVNDKDTGKHIDNLVATTGAYGDPITNPARVRSVGLVGL